MCSDKPAIRVRDITKHYLMFERPEDRLKQMVQPRLARLFGRPGRQYYRDFAALNGISFDIGRGETVGIIGRNGCGKSTLLQIVCGTFSPSSGSVEVNGRIAALLELGAGFNPDFTGRENVYLNASILGLTKAETDARFDDIARFADIGIFIDQPVKTYSSGMYVRLAFAVAVNIDPDILVVDEALAVGDEAFQRKCFARIENIREKGATILFVSHAAQAIVQLCDRAMLFDRGEMIMEGRPKTVVNQYQRFVNASEDSAKQIREEIRVMDGWAVPDRKEDAVDVERDGRDDADGAAERNTVSASTAQGDDESWYDPSLIADSRVEYESRGARIHDVRITTLDGRQVNVLKNGFRYIYEYKVEFLKDFESVGFGTLLRTVQGFELGGTSSNLLNKKLNDVQRGQIAKAKFSFDVRLAPGAYFLNAGVGTVGNNARLLHRIVDAMVFRVAVEPTTRFSGVVDFGFSPELEVL